ncbi:MAG: hypothetical protein OYK82_09165 [Gammaproteobacteria bacterium]|nr:hypothetical protein [Gammaproteobacteria bacterium]
MPERRLPDGRIEIYEEEGMLGFGSGVTPLTMEQVAEALEMARRERQERRSTTVDPETPEIGKATSEKQRRREATRRRFSDPIIVNTDNLTPEQKERLKLQNEAFRRAIYLKDFSLGRQLGLFPPKSSEEEVNRDVPSGELTGVER